MIVAVTPKPAYDVTYELAALVVGGVHRVTEVRQRVRGRGINVARVLDTFGWPDLLLDAVAMSAATVLAPVAGHVDIEVCHELSRRVTVSTVPVPRSAA